MDLVKVWSLFFRLVEVKAIRKIVFYVSDRRFVEDGGLKGFRSSF